jgi:aminoglycoside phosphotransferase (APT) family kinase protein
MAAWGAKAKMATATAGVAAQMLKEKVRPPKPPRTLADVPTSAEHLTPEWLTAVLCREHPEHRVTAFALGGENKGTSDRRGVTVTYADPAGAAAAGLPTAIFTKASPSFTSRLVLGLTGTARSECLFYNEFRNTVPLNSPIGYHGAYDDASWRSMVVIEDCAVTRGATFGDALQALTRTEAENVVDELAILHGAYWGSPLLTRPEPRPQTARDLARLFDDMIGCRAQTQVGIDRASDVIPDEFLAIRNDFYDPFLEGLDRDLRGPITLLHQDPHPGNWFRDAEGRMGLYDWQGVASGHWAVDLCYALQAAIPVEDRRAWEEDLIRRYVERLEAAGGPALPFEDAWSDYRTHAYHGLVFWLYTIGRSRLQPEMQPDAFSREIIKRISQATIDHDTLTLLQVQNRS